MRFAKVEIVGCWRSLKVTVEVEVIVVIYLC